jgi:hypothetical protein
MPISLDVVNRFLPAPLFAVVGVAELYLFDQSLSYILIATHQAK